jgi:asparagine synthase (glutamine-hydrolysing)
LSGGLDSSTLVAIQRHRIGTDKKPVPTISLVGPDPAHCADARAVRAIVESGAIDPILVSATEGRTHAEAFVSICPSLDDPFALFSGYPMWVGMRRARDAGFRVLLEGMCSDLFFYSPERTRQVLIEQRMLRRIPDVVRAHARHGLDTRPLELARRLLGTVSPMPLRRLFRQIKQRKERVPTREESGNHYARFHQHVAAAFDNAKRAASGSPPPSSPLQAHARIFTGGLMSFAHALEGGLARREGLEERSPFSDRRLIEFAIRMPTEAKLAAPWYKHFLRLAVQDMLPPQVVWRTDLGSHPGIHFHEGLLVRIEHTRPELLDSVSLSRILGEWLRPQAIKELCDLRQHTSDSNVTYNLLNLAMLSHWLDTHFP